MSGEQLEAGPPAEDEGGGVPAWVMTFADLMTLLMCFFVLLLAFSEMDVLKFKQLSGSVREAFGVQTEIEAKTIPKGTSVIAQEFSPGIPEPTPLNVVRQFTMESEQNSLDFEPPELITEEKRAREDARRTAERIRVDLSAEIQRGAVAVRLEGRRIVIQLLEKATFPSGYARMSVASEPVLKKIRAILAENLGAVQVSGHSDDVPISNERFRSNWALSTSRAVSVLHALLRSTELKPERFTVSGHADTKPLVPNSDSVNRAQNRRVDITIIKSSGKTERLRFSDEPDRSEPGSEPEQAGNANDAE